jgi:transposase
VAMDMSAPYALATRECIPDGQNKIVLDRFHIMRMVNDALNRVRQQEYGRADAQKRQQLKGTKQLWLWAQENLPLRYHDRLAELKSLDLETSRAWAMKENLRRFWEMPSSELAQKHLRRWLSWARRSRIKPMVQLAKVLGAKTKQILNYATHRITSGVAEGINSKVQSVKRKAAGYRNTWNFMQAIMFYCGKLDLYPR